MAVAKRTWTTLSGEVRTAWVVRYYDDQGIYRQKTFERARDAKAYERRVKGEVEEGTHVPDSTSVTIGEVGKLLLERKEANGNEPDSIRVDETYLRLHIVPASVPEGTLNGWTGKFGDFKFSKLTTPICDAFGLHLLKTKSRYTARRALGRFKQIGREAQRRGLLKRNPAEPIKIEELDREKVPLQIGVDIPDKADVRAILAAVSPDRVIPRRPGGGRRTPFFLGRWFILFLVAAFTGMRASELRALTWRNVDLVGRVIHVIQRANRKGKIGPPKSKAGYRDILISAEVVDDLRGWRLVCPDPTPDGLVFSNSLGKVEAHTDILRSAWYPVQKRLGMTDAEGNTKYGFHGLRHFYASIMIEAGVQPKRLQGLLGHARLQETMDTYGHLFPVSATETDQINGAVAAVLAGDQDGKKGPQDDMR
jgi:integrase